MATGCVNGKLPNQSGEMAESIGVKVDVIVLKYLDDNDIPGATVAVTKNGRLVLSKGYGAKQHGSGEQMQPHHRAFIGSVSKVPTTIGLLQLVEDGQLALGDPVYANAIAALWNFDQESPPVQLEYSQDGVLEDPEKYLQALASAVKDLQSPWPSGAPYVGEPPAYLLTGDFQSNVNKVLDWASEIEVWNLLTHTAGLPGSGQPAAAAAAFGVNVADLTYAQLHEHMLEGGHGYPLKFPAGTNEDYSNHGFGVAGLIIEEQSGQSYHDYMQENVFHPLGLFDITPAHVSIDEELDASPHKLDADGDIVVQSLQDNLSAPTLGLATGGWRATAQDLVRVMCGIDVPSNNLRLLTPATASTMATVLYPSAGASAGQPLGWDDRYATPSLTKGGLVPQLGGARITKYLPGGFDNVEINVAVVTNRNHQPDVSLLRDIATEVRDADIPATYDLFDPNYRCRKPPEPPATPPGVQVPTLPTAPAPTAPETPTVGAELAPSPTEVPQPTSGAIEGAPGGTTSTTGTQPPSSTTTSRPTTTTTRPPPSTTTTTQPETTTTTARESTTTTEREPATTTTTQPRSTTTPTTTPPREPRE